MLATIKEFFKQRQGIDAIYLFGSQARMSAGPESDVDVGVLFSEDAIPDGPGKLDMQEQLALLLRRDVDLIALNHVSPIVKYQVLQHGQLILNNQPAAVQEFIVKALLEYEDLKRIRAPIERALSQRTYYGG